MDKVMQGQNFAHYPFIMDLIRKAEKLFHCIQMMESAMPLQDEERLFIDAIRGLNFQASRLQAEEQLDEAPPQPVQPLFPKEVEISDKLDVATSILVDAAMKLNGNSSNMPSPDLHSALSWMRSTVKRPVVGEEPSTDEELEEDLHVTYKKPKLL